MENELIHPTASISSGAKIGNGTRIGRNCVIEGDVVIGDNCVLKENVIVREHTRLGNEVKLFPFAVVGEEPQHLKYNGEPTTVEIGNGVVLREFATVHRGTSPNIGGIGTTRIDEQAYLMAYTHVAHDCKVGRNAILANEVQMAGHSTIEDFATVGGFTALTQHCRIGRYCYIGGASVLRKDLPPFLLGKGNAFEVQGVNVIGLARRGFSDTTIRRLRKLYKIFYLQHLTVKQAKERVLLEIGDTDEARVFLDFVDNSRQGIVR